MGTTFPWQPTAARTVPETVCVNSGGDLHLYAAGFRKGAEALLEVVRSIGHGQDLLVCPIVYSLRHSVELLLKQVTRAGRRLVDEPGDFPDGHRLDNLWSTCRPVLKKIWPSDPSYAKVESVITRLCELDPKGESFHYPVSTRRQGVRATTLDPDLRHLDLGTLVSEVLEVIQLLNGAGTSIDACMDTKYDMEEEARAIEREMREDFEAQMRAEYADEMRSNYL